MKLSVLLKTIKESQEYNNFIKLNPDSELTAGFVVLDLKSEINEYSLDYKIEEKTIASFTLSSVKPNISERQEEIFDKTKKLNPLDISKVIVDIDELPKILEQEMKNQNINKPIEKIIAVLHQDSKGAITWNLTAICQSFTIISAILDAKSNNPKFLKFDKKSLFDFAVPVKNSGLKP